MSPKLGLISLIFLSACANVVPPTGGQPDLVAPKILALSLDSSNALKKAYRIEIQFDELVELKAGSSIYFYPGGITPSKTQVRKQVLQLEFDSLLNLNGLLDLGEAIQDVNNQNAVFESVLIVGEKVNLQVDTSRISFSNFMDNSGSFPFWLEIRDSSGVLLRKKKVEKNVVFDFPYLNATGCLAKIMRKEKGDSITRSISLRSKFEEISLGWPFGDEAFFGPDSLIDATFSIKGNEPVVLFEFRDGKWFRCRKGEKGGIPLVSGKVILGYYSNLGELKILNKEIKKGENNAQIDEFLSSPSPKR
jgi:hypothetical protein